MPTVIPSGYVREYVLQLTTPHPPSSTPPLAEDFAHLRSTMEDVKGGGKKGKKEKKPKKEKKAEKPKKEKKEKEKKPSKEVGSKRFFFSQSVNS